MPGDSSHRAVLLTTKQEAFNSSIIFASIDEGRLMQTGRILISLDIIESTIRNYQHTKLEITEKIINNEILNIHHSTDDNSVIELAYCVYHNWKVFSGQLQKDGYISKRNTELNYIFTDLSKIRSYLNKFYPGESFLK